MRSRNDLHIMPLVLASALLAGCTQTGLQPQSSARPNQIYYSDLHRLPEGTVATISVSGHQGEPAAPDLTFTVSELPVHFEWPPTLRADEGGVKVHALLALDGRVLAQAQANSHAGQAVDMQLSAVSSLGQHPALAGTKWRVLSYGGRSTLGYTQAHVRFGAEGRLSGYGGCNQYQATYQHVGALVGISALNATRKICFSSVMYQENALFKMLGKVTHLRWSGEELLLFGDNSDHPVRLSSLNDY